MDTIKLVVTGKNKIWFTSDQHFFHENIIKFCNRPFENIEIMNKAIIDNWNECVGDEDVVFSLGDFVWWNDPIKIRDIISQLKGKKIIFIMGNHDKIESFLGCSNERIKIIKSDIVHVKVKFQDLKSSSTVELVLSHYPLMTWSGRNRKSINLYGHVHSRENDTGFDHDIPMWKGLQMDVGVDAHNYKPVDLQKILLMTESEGKEPEKKDIPHTTINLEKFIDGKEVLITTIINDTPIKSRYSFSENYLKEVESKYNELIINILKDHKMNILEHGGPLLENIISNKQLEDLKNFFIK